MILKKHQRNKFALIDSEVLLRRDLSAKAKGVLAFLMAQHPDWKPSAESICDCMTDGVHSIYTALKELRQTGYLKLESTQGEKGAFTGSEWHVSDAPIFLEKSPRPGKSESPENPSLGKPQTDNTICNSIQLSMDNSIDNNSTRKSLFGNSNVCLSEVYTNKFAKEIAAGIDVVYYVGVVNDWSDSKDVKRTNRGWIATIKTFMRGDAEKRKLKMVNANPQQQAQLSEEYLRM